MKISEISRACGVSMDTLRYYERIGLMPRVHRNGGGIREYDDVDVKRIEFIKCMRGVGLPIEALLEYFRLVQQGDETMAARKQMLVEQRAQLLERMEEMQATLVMLDGKIAGYERAVAQAEVALEMTA
jgi:DNA-binding transcriptional MerR regulator